MRNGTLFITDLDGTLLTPEARLSEKTAETLNRLISEGLRFTVATARSRESAVPILRELRMTEPVVLLNGVLIYDLLATRYIHVEAMCRDSMGELLSRVRWHGMNGFLYVLRGQTMETHYEKIEGEAMSAFCEKRKKIFGKVFTHTPDFTSLLDETLIYLTLKDTAERLEPVYEDLRIIPGITAEFYTDTYDNRWWYLECHSDRATKYNGARFVKEYAGAGRLIGFGDNLNDIPLLNACDEGYAVANAREELKAAATGVIGSNREDGVALFLEALWNA